jgi:quercetin 2,3-dioxygenase
MPNTTWSKRQHEFSRCDGESVEHVLREPRLAYLVPSTGTVEVNGVRIHTRDGAAIKDVDIAAIRAIEDADVVMVDVL